MNDLLIRNANLTDGRTGIDILIRQGRIESLDRQIDASGLPELDAQGNLLTTPFVDAHFHMDAVLSYGLPRVNQLIYSWQTITENRIHMEMRINKGSGQQISLGI